MGYLTTITIYNDGLADLKDNPQAFVDQVYAAAAGSYSLQYPTDVRIGGFCNFAKVQKPRHADDHTVYVHAGNTLCEMRAGCAETEKIMKHNPKFFQKLLEEMEDQCQELRRQFEEMCSTN